MASVYDLKPKFQALLRPLLRGLHALGFTPNGLTLLALAGSFALGGMLWLRPGRAALIAVPVWLFLRMALNALDGMMAREMNLASRLGAVLNETGDVLADAAIYLPLAWAAAPLAGALFVLGALFTEFCGLLSQTLGAGRNYRGPLGKSDRAFIAGALALVALWRPATVAYWPGVFALAAGLELLTGINRLFPALRKETP
jgi:phosphatidylglycerophosphate synthase